MLLNAHCMIAEVQKRFISITVTKCQLDLESGQDEGIGNPMITELRCACRYKLDQGWGFVEMLLELGHRISCLVT
jgi:hypothetical protein